MGDTNELMEFLSASLGPTLDEIYQLLINCDFTREDPGLAMFAVALLNALGRVGRDNCPTEVVLMLAFGESGTAERGRNRLMRCRRGEMSGHDLAREPGLGERRDHRLGEIPLPVQPAQPLIGAKRLRDGPGPSHSVDSPTAAPHLKRVKVSEIEIQTSETIETLEKKENDQNELCAKLQEYRTISRERNEWMKKFEDLQIAYKEDEIKLLGGIQGHTSQDEGTGAVLTERARGSSADITVCSQPEKHNTGPLGHLSRSSVPGVVPSGSQSSYERDQ